MKNSIMEITITNNYIEKEIKIPIGNIVLEGDLIIPEMATGLVIFSHGKGSSRFCAHNNMVAQELRNNGIGTFLFDLLTIEEGVDTECYIDIKCLTKRLKTATGHKL